MTESHVRVVCLVRPANDQEHLAANKSSLSKLDAQYCRAETEINTISVRVKGNSHLQFVDNCAASTVSDILSGYNGLIVAYGQTDSGMHQVLALVQNASHQCAIVAAQFRRFVRQRVRIATLGSVPSAARKRKVGTMTARYVQQREQSVALHVRMSAQTLLATTMKLALFGSSRSATAAATVSCLLATAAVQKDTKGQYDVTSSHINGCSIFYECYFVVFLFYYLMLKAYIGNECYESARQLYASPEFGVTLADHVSHILMLNLCGRRQWVWFNLGDGYIRCGKKKRHDHYDEDCMVLNKNLGSHLAHFGIDIMSQEKYDNTLNEMEISLMHLEHTTCAEQA